MWAYEHTRRHFVYPRCNNRNTTPPTPRRLLQVRISLLHTMMPCWNTTNWTLFAVTIMNTTMTKEICAMIMMLTSARDIWNKHVSMYEQNSGQRLNFLICGRQLKSMEKWEIPQKILNRSCPKFAWVITSEPLLLCKILSRYDYSLSPPNMEKCATNDSVGFLFLV